MADLGVIAFSIVVAVFLIKTGIIETVLNQTQGVWFLGSFIAGAFFTSMFTVAPATVALGVIAQASPSLFIFAILGGLGALCGDLIIFRFVRDRLATDIMQMLNLSKRGRIRSFMRLKLFTWLTFSIGALVIASPLPDELGLAMMGVSKTKTSLFVPVSFVFNSIGIFVIGFIAKNLLGN